MPRPSLELHPEAVEEAREARAWYAARSPAAADSFMTELELALDRILEAPDRAPRYIVGTRRLLLRRFPYIVVYRQRQSVVQIVAVAHGRRKPGYWRARTRN